MAKTNYKGHDIDQHSEHRFYVKRFNDTIKGGVMFTTIEKAQAYIDSHINENV